MQVQAENVNSHDAPWETMIQRLSRPISATPGHWLGYIRKNTDAVTPSAHQINEVFIICIQLGFTEAYPGIMHSSQSSGPSQLGHQTTC